ncbi:MAG: class I SAM-dependent methyltransferase [Chromatiales bacterium]
MNDTATAKPTARRLLEGWFEREPGRSLLEAVAGRLDALLPNLFGYHIVQLGSFRNAPLLAASRISHQVVLGIAPAAGMTAPHVVRCTAGALPIASDCVDVAVLPYVLEFEEDPHQVLREVDRVLIGEGHVVIVGFNPWSCWGLWRLMLAWSETPPWCNRFLRLGRIKDWLHLLGFEVTSASRLFFRPPLRSARMLRHLAFMEKFGRRLLPFAGGAYVVVAKKRLQRLIPIKTQWHTRRQLITAGYAEPTTRVSDRND